MSSTLFEDAVGSTLVTTLYARAHAGNCVPTNHFDDPQARDVWSRLVELAHDEGVADPTRLALGDVNTTLGTVRRSLVMDQLAWEFVLARPGAQVVTLGIGLCNRSARLRTLPADFYGVDRRAVIDLRRRLIPVDRTELIVGSACEPGWLQALPTGAPTLVIAEGLLMYLTPHEVTTLLTRIGERFGDGTRLLADVFHPLATTMGHPIQSATGARFRSGHVGASGLALTVPGWHALGDTDIMDESGFVPAQVNSAFRVFAGTTMYSVAEIGYVEQ